MAIYTFEYNNTTDFSYFYDPVEGVTFLSNYARLKASTPPGGLFYVNYVEEEKDAIWSFNNADGTLIPDASIVNGVLVNGAIRYSLIDNTASGEAGCIRLQVIPQYINPTEDTVLLQIYDSSNPTLN